MSVANADRLAVALGLRGHATELARGSWSSAFAVDSPDGRRVLRIADQRDDFDKDALAAAWARPGLPIPAVDAVGAWEGRYYALSRWVPGEPLESSDGASVMGALGEMLRAKAAVTPSGDGWGGMDGQGRGSYSSWSAHLMSSATDDPGRRTHGWWDKLRADPERVALHERHVALLAAAAIDDVPRGVIHGDLLNRNVHVAGSVITGVFDWGCAAYGDPLYDLAWFEFMAPHYPQLDPDALIAAVLGGPPSVTERRRMLACHLHIGVDHLGFNAHGEKWGVFADVVARTEQLLVDYTDVAPVRL